MKTSLYRPPVTFKTCFARLTFHLSAAFVVIIFAVQMIARLQPPPEALAALHLTDCALPCWLGITPGQTTFDEAAQSVTAAYPDATVLRDSVILADFSADAAYARVTLQAQDGIIGWILLNFDDSTRLALGDVALLFGSPSCELPSSQRTVIYNAAQTYATVLAGNQVRERWHKPLITIDIGINNPRCQFFPDGVSSTRLVK